MTDRMQRFCDLYLSNGRNATRAYKEAGYRFSTDASAQAGASRLLRNDKVLNYLNNHMESLRAKAEHESRLMTAEELAQWFCDVANGVELDGNDCPKMSDRIKAAELYGKYLNVFSTNVNVKTTEPIVIHNNVSE